MAAQVVFPVIVKQITRGIVPVIHRGAEAVPLYKSKGGMADRKSYRSIALQCSLGKIASRTWRIELKKTFERLASTLQGGARKGLGPNAHVTRIRVMPRLACKRHQSFGLIVMDLESAFYKTVRGILLQNAQEAMSAEFLAYLFRALDLPPLIYDDFLQQMERTTVLEEGKTNRAIQRVLGSMMQGAWSRLPGDGRIMVPETGTRPGDPIADIMWRREWCRRWEPPGKI